MSRLWTSTAVALCLALAGCGSADPASSCASSGGTVVTQQCCKSASEFPSTCLVGACGCSPDNSAPLSACSCPTNKCFDGTGCVAP